MTTRICIEGAHIETESLWFPQTSVFFYMEDSLFNVSLFDFDLYLE